MNAEELFEDLPGGLLEQMYGDQRRALKEMGIDVPSEGAFEEKLPLWRRVMLLDWLLREALSGDGGPKVH